MGLDHGLLHGDAAVNDDDAYYGDRAPELITWRKFNAVHAWFVDNVQDGVDDCGRYRVTRAQLSQLCSVMDEVLEASELTPGTVTQGSMWSAETGWQDVQELGFVIKDPGVAQRLLPTREGFFYGWTGYDDSYLGDVKEARDVLVKALASCGDDAVFTYWSSW